MKKYAIKITLIYLVLGSIWILTTDRISPPSFLTKELFDTFKGILFIITTSMILYYLLHRTEIVSKRIVRNLKENARLKSFAEKRLLDERNILRAIIDNIPDYIYVKDQHNNQLVTNKSLWEMLGATSEEETLGKNVYKLLRPDVAEEFEKHDQLTFDSMQTELNTMHEFHNPHGENRWLLVTKVPLQDADGKCTGMVGISKDITEIRNKNQRDQLVYKIIHDFGSQSSIERGLQKVIQIICETFNFGIGEAWIVNENNSYIDLTAKWTSKKNTYFDSRQTQFKSGEGLVGFAWMRGEIQIWEDVQENPDFLQKELAQQQNLHFGISIPIVFNGNVISVFSFLTSEFQDDFFEIKQLLEDISDQLGFHIDRKQNEIKLQDFTTQIGEILESINDGFISYSNDWTVTYWNKSAEALLGIPRESIVGHNLFDIIPGSKNYKFTKVYQKVFDTKKAAHFEQHIPEKEIWLAMSAYPTKDGLSVFFKDITESKLIDVERRKRLRESNAKNAELEHFAYIASHDLQEPLRMVTSFLTQIEKKYNDLLDDKGRQYIHFAVDGAVRMRKIILDLLEYSRIGKEAFADEEVSIYEILDGIKLLNATLFEEKAVTIIADNLPTIIAKKALIRQLFQNIILNAVRYAKVDVAPVITIGCEDDGDYWKFSIEDNGIGISPEFYEKVFILFQRLHLERNLPGTGLGLAICKKIVEAHDGRIWIESPVNIGTIFYFTIKK